MKRFVFMALVALGLSATTTLTAQPRTAKEHPTPEQMAQHITERMTGELGLNAAQAKEVYALQLEQINTMDAHREAMRKERQNEATKMKGILSAEQYEKWSDMQSYKRHKGNKGNKDCNNCGKCDKCKKRNCAERGTQK